MATLHIKRIGNILYYSLTEPLLSNVTGKGFAFSQRNWAEQLDRYGSDIRPIGTSIIRFVIETEETRGSGRKCIDCCNLDAVPREGFAETLLVGLKTGAPIESINEYLKAFISTILRIDSAQIEDRTLIA